MWRMTFLKIRWTEQTRVRPIHSLAFQPNGDTISPMRHTLSAPSTTNNPPPSVPGKQRASVRMTALSSPARLLMIPLLRVLMKRSKQREPKGEPHATTGLPFWRDELLCHGCERRPAGVLTSLDRKADADFKFFAEGARWQELTVRAEGLIVCDKTRVSMKTKHSPQCILADGLRTVDLIPQDENR
ncbi:hypothetical protein INR49_021700, partial [Caranx melampygus]